MPTYNLKADLSTGDLHVLGRDGRLYTVDEIEDAEARAKHGDPAAVAVLRAVDASQDYVALLGAVSELLPKAAPEPEPSPSPGPTATGRRPAHGAGSLDV